MLDASRQNDEFRGGGSDEDRAAGERTCPGRGNELLSPGPAVSTIAPRALATTLRDAVDQIDRGTADLDAALASRRIPNPPFSDPVYTAEAVAPMERAAANLRVAADIFTTAEATMRRQPELVDGLPTRATYSGSLDARLAARAVHGAARSIEGSTSSNVRSSLERPLGQLEQTRDAVLTAIAQLEQRAEG